MMSDIYLIIPTNLVQCDWWRANLKCICTTINPPSTNLGPIFFAQVSQGSCSIHVFNINMTKVEL